jgi:predicted kinase
MTTRHTTTPATLERALGFVDDLGPCLLSMLGMAGAGKTTLARFWRPEEVISNDAIRGELAGDSGDQSRNPEVIAEAHARIEARYAAGQRTDYDGINTTPKHRRVTPGLTHRLPAIAVLVDEDIEVCLARQHARRAGHQVPCVRDPADAGRARLCRAGRVAGEGFVAALIARAVCDTYDVEIHQR